LLNNRNSKYDFQNLISCFEDYFEKNDKKLKGLKSLIINQNLFMYENLY
jgi:hypothetical protein